MLLVEEGAVALDDPVSRYLPPGAWRDKDAVTLRHLLTHSSGLRPWRAYHEALLERERRQGQHWLGTPRGRQWVLDSVCARRWCTSRARPPCMAISALLCSARWWRM